VPQVRLISETGEQVGVITRDEAMTMAREVGMDLVEVAPEAEPPVCRIMDYGKHKYRKKKKTHQSHVKQHVSQLKALRLGPTTEEHDLQVKLRKAREFLARRDRVVFNIMFRGRQMLHREQGDALMTRIQQELEPIVKIESPPRMEGRRLWMVVSPKH
jgi:translation initiation factor IF-3